MKKLSSMIALGLTLSMLMGMTVFASDSPSGNALPTAPEGSNYTVNEFNLSDSKTTEEQAMAALPAEAKAQNAKEVMRFDLTGTSAPPNNEVKLTGISVVKLNDGKIYKALHFVDGAWKVHDVEVTGDGAITIKGVTKFSPFILVSYTEPEEEEEDNGYYVDTVAAPASATGTPVSPKTGETFPAAVAVMFAALAGAAAVGARKIGMNR